MAAKSLKYEIGDSVQVQLFWDWEWIWVSGKVVEIKTKVSGKKLVLVDTEFGVLECKINNRLRHIN